MPKGGKREGAGRKPLGPENMTRISVALPTDLAAWVRTRPGGASAFVRGMLGLEWRRFLETRYPWDRDGP